MHKEDEELLARLKREQEKRGLVLEENIDEGGFRKVIQRLIEEPPAPKRKRGKRGTKSRREKAKKLKGIKGLLNPKLSKVTPDRI
jgi:hypothetical protein